MSTNNSTRPFYVLFALLLVGLAIGGVVLWRAVDAAAPAAPPPQTHTNDPFVGTAQVPDATLPEPENDGPDEDSRNGERETPQPIDYTPRAGTDSDRKPDAAAGARAGVTSMADLLRKLAAIKSQGASVNVREEFQELGRELAREDFDNALRLLNAVSDFFTKSNLCRGIFEERALTDPRSAMEAARAMNPGERTTATAARHLQKQRVYFEALIATMKGWSYSNPAEAASALAELPEDYQLTAANEIYTAWAASDPEAAITAMDQLTPEAQRRILPEVLNGWAESSPADAWDFVLSLPEGTIAAENLVLANIATTWAEQDPIAAVQRVDRTLTEDRQYADVLERTTRQLATQSPATAAALLSAVPGMYERQSALLSTTLRTWVGSDPVAAADWVGGIVDPGMKSRAVKVTAAYWGTQDAEAALAWANSLDDGISRAYALSNVAVQQGRRNPTQSPDWLYEIDGEFAQARAVAGYIMGRVQRAGDRGTTEALREMISRDTLDFTVVQELLLDAEVSDDERRELLGLVQ